MPIDPSIPLQVQQTNPMQTFGQMAGIANTMQGMQARSLAMQGQQNANEQSGQDLQEMKALQPIQKNISKYMDANGNVNFNQLIPDVMQAAPKNGMDFVKNMAGGMQQKAAAQNAISTQSMEGRTAAANAIRSLPDDASVDMIQKTGDAVSSTFNDPNAQAASNSTFQNLASSKSTHADDFAAFKQHAAAMFLPQATQQNMQAVQQGIDTPQPLGIDNGQQSYDVNIKPGANIPQGAVIPGTMNQKQLPPNTPTMSGTTPGYLGATNFPAISPQDQNNADQERLRILNQEMSTEKDPQNKIYLQNEIANTQKGIQQRSGFVPSGLPVGAAQNIGSNVDEMNRHFASLQDASTGNQLVQSLTGNIKSLAKVAITGTESDKLNYVNGLLAALPGHGYSDDLKQANDMLAKQMAQLNMSSPQSTDAAMKLRQAGQPNSHMSAGSMNEAADQIASQVQANTAIRNHLSGYKYANNGQGDPQAYQQERQNIENVADPRAWQYMSLKPGSPEAKSFAQQHPEIGPKVRQLENMGMLK